MKWSYLTPDGIEPPYSKTGARRMPLLPSRSRAILNPRFQSPLDEQWGSGHAPPPGYDPYAQHDEFMARLDRLNLPKRAAMVGTTGEEAPNDFGEALISALITFTSGHDIEPPASGSAARPGVAEIAKHTATLMNALGHINPRSWMAMQEAYECRIPDGFDEAHWLEQGLNFAGVEWDQLAESLGCLREVGVAAAEAPLPSKKGRKAERDLAKLIRALAAIDQRHAGIPAHKKLA